MKNKVISEDHLKKLESLSLFLHELRINIGFTQKQLSENLNLSRNSIQLAENFRKPHNLTILSIFELCDGLEISPSELFADID